VINREIPFRPRLEGNFRLRFYNAVSTLDDNTSIVAIEDIANQEIIWVENECTYNLEQRKKYRAVWLLFRDLIRASWRACYRDGVLLMRLPSLNGTELNDTSSPKVKALLRSWMEESRHERLVSYSEFIYRMEKTGDTKQSIAELIADGNELADRIERVRDGKTDVSVAVQPYLQLVRENDRDEYTGLKISEIWRYFRLTWSTPAETTPGRTMQYLIRDAAHPRHAIMGIASLENCAVQITCRDDAIGWNQKAFIDKVSLLAADEVRSEFERLLSYLEDGINGIDYHELCTTATVFSPTDEDIQMLLDEAAIAEQARQNSLRESQDDIIEEERSELGSISLDTENALYRRKRAEQLARLLSAKKAITNVCASSDFDTKWLDFCKSEAGNSAIRSALIAQKTKHIGSSIMELNVCGAIPPYNEILGGKLVALLAVSPQIVHDYKERYLNKSSEIASRLKGEPVYRPADLVYVGTTSLYFVGSSQYNRLRIPDEVFGSGSDVTWQRLGMTIGFGTMHISKATTLSLTEATSDGFNRINHVFGEGASPKMRLLTMAIRELLESTNEDSKEFSKHAMSRIVYGARLACNSFDYLLGKDSTPKYYFGSTDYSEGTRSIVDYWRNRWLTSRLKFAPIYNRIRNFEKSTLLVSNEIQRSEQWSFSKMQEVLHMVTDSEPQKGLEFIRNFYRGSSAYADYVSGNQLSNIHLVTRLDKAILDAVKAGKDVVLTGNPGDGKTHIIRILKEQFDSITQPISIELDASTKSNEEIFAHWQEAKNKGHVFLIAINAAVLYSLRHFCPNFRPVVNAYNQMSQAVVFHGGTLQDDDVVVFDLSKRDILSKEILKQAIIKLTGSEHYAECKMCPLKDSCEVHKNCELLNNELFQERLYSVLQRVTLQGYHATLRELQSLIAYLIFGDRTCNKISKTVGNKEYNLINLIYSGKGDLFKAINSAMDPTRISHPVWDELILCNEIPEDSWVAGYSIPQEAIAFDNDDLFRLRKRQFFFFNKHGDELLNIIDDDVSRFQAFLAQDDKKAIKELIRKQNIFFGATKPSSDLEIWSGHRYDNDTRKVLLSIGSMKASAFKIGRAALQQSMQAGIEMPVNYLRLEKKDVPGIFLKIDFDMYSLLSEAERGVPVLFTESDLVKKVWRFIEQLQSAESFDQDIVVISLLDVQNKKEVRVTIDLEDKKYTAIESIKK